MATRCARRPACGACHGVSERQWRSAANRSRLPPRSVLGAPHRGAAPEPAGETKSFCPCKNACPQALRKPHGLGIFRAYAGLDTFPRWLFTAAIQSSTESPHSFNRAGLGLFVVLLLPGSQNRTQGHTGSSLGFTVFSWCASFAAVPLTAAPDNNSPLYHFTL